MEWVMPAPGERYKAYGDQKYEYNTPDNEMISSMFHFDLLLDFRHISDAIIRFEASIIQGCEESFSILLKSVKQM
jgi:hypothetical protein